MPTNLLAVESQCILLICVFIATLGEAGIRVKVDLVFILLMMSALIEAIVGKGGV